MRIAWLEEAHFPENYYDALQQPLRALGHTVVERRVPLAAASLADTDLALAGFGLFAQEVKSLPALPEFEPSSSTSLCGVEPLVVILNKEYVGLAEKKDERQQRLAAKFAQPGQQGYIKGRCQRIAVTFLRNLSTNFHHFVQDLTVRFSGRSKFSPQY